MAVVERNLQAQRTVLKQWAHRHDSEHLLEQCATFEWGGEDGAPTHNTPTIR